MIQECPACYSNKISSKRLIFRRIIYYIEDNISKLKTLFGYKCLSCGYNINEDHKEVMNSINSAFKK